MFLITVSTVGICTPPACADVTGRRQKSGGETKASAPNLLEYSGPQTFLSQGTPFMISKAHLYISHITEAST